MPKTRISDAQIAFAFGQGERGTPIGETCRKIGVAEATFCRWKKVYARVGRAEIRHEKMREDETITQKRLAVDLTLDKSKQQDVLRLKW